MELLQQKIGYTFKNISYLHEALTHSSYANEQHNPKIVSNERLEFLGDAVLSIISAEYLFKKFPEYPEGKLSKLRSSLVCTQSLSSFANELSLGEYLYLGKGEAAPFLKTPLRHSLPPFISTAVCSRQKNLFCLFSHAR